MAKFLLNTNSFKFIIMKHRIRLSTYNFMKTSIIILVSFLLISCSEESIDYGDPRLSAQIVVPNQLATKGLSQLGFASERDGILYVPESYTPEKAMPLLVALHGAGGSSSYWKSYYSRAESRDMILLAIDSRSYTWDLIQGEYGDDVQFLDRALKYVFYRCKVDSAHIALCGFSDGATYTLSLGISNGDLFTHLIGHSPGFVVDLEPIVGKPQIYISHGTKDYVLSVQETRNNIVPTFIGNGYNVTYNEFEGGHLVPDVISEAALDWFVGPIIDNTGER